MGDFFKFFVAFSELYKTWFINWDTFMKNEITIKIFDRPRYLHFAKIHTEILCHHFYLPKVMHGTSLMSTPGQVGHVLLRFSFFEKSTKI